MLLLHTYRHIYFGRVNLDTHTHITNISYLGFRFKGLGFRKFRDGGVGFRPAV